MIGENRRRPKSAARNWILLFVALFAVVVFVVLLVRIVKGRNSSGRILLDTPSLTLNRLIYRPRQRTSEESVVYHWRWDSC